MTTTDINIPFITANEDGYKNLSVRLTRADFDRLTADLVERTLTPVRNAMSDAGLQSSQLDKVLLVGGSTRIPAVQEAVKKATGKEPSKTLNPDECVAIGAAIQGGKLSGESGAGDILLLDVTPLTLGIETMGGVATPLIERNTTIPAKKSQVFSTAENNQTAVDIHVVQGERPLAKDNKTLGRFRLDGIPAAPRGIPQIEVTFDIDANGIVNVTAKDLGTGKEQKITITASTNLSDDEIDKAVKEAEQYAAEDKKRKEAIDAQNEADAMVFQTEKSLEELGDKVPAADKSAIEAEMSKLKALVEKNKNNQTISEAEVAELKAQTEALTKALNEMATKMYQQANPQGGAEQGGFNNTGSSGPDDVVDADFKEV